MIGFIVGLALGFGLHYALCKYNDKCKCFEFAKLKAKVVKANKKKKRASMGDSVIS